MTEKSSSAKCCPLCGADNQCAVAAGKPADSCWCMTVQLDETARAEAAAITDAQCMCPACGQPQTESNP